MTTCGFLALTLCTSCGLFAQEPSDLKRLQEVGSLLTQKIQAFANIHPECGDSTWAELSPEDLEKRLATCLELMQTAIAVDQEWQALLRQERSLSGQFLTYQQVPSLENWPHIPTSDLYPQLERQAMDLMILLEQAEAYLLEVGEYGTEKSEVLRKSDFGVNMAWWLGEDPMVNEQNGNGLGWEVWRGFRRWGKMATEKLQEKSTDSQKRMERWILPPTVEHQGQPESWVMYTFSGPLVANLAMIEALKVDVIEMRSTFYKVVQEKE